MKAVENKWTGVWIVAMTMLTVYMLVPVVTAQGQEQDTAAPPMGALVEQAQPEEQTSTPAATPALTPVYQLTEGDRLAVSQTETILWQAKYVVELREKELAEMVSELRRRCVASGGELTIPSGQSMATARCSRKETEPDETPES